MKGKIFNAQEMQALIAGNKTQFREVIKVQPSNAQQQFSTIECSTNRSKIGKHIFIEIENQNYITNRTKPFKCPYQVGQMIFVKEIWGIGSRPDPWGGYQGIEYKADKTMIDKGDALPCYEIDIYEVPAGVCLDYFSSSWQNARTMPQWASRIILQIKEIRVEKENNLWVWVIQFDVIKN